MVNPHRWVIVKHNHPDLKEDEVIFKVFGMWYGGYLDGDSWRINSGIVDVKDEDDKWIFVGYSGSEYACYKDAYGFTGYGIAVMQPQIESGLFEALDQREDWATLLQEVN